MSLPAGWGWLLERPLKRPRYMSFIWWVLYLEWIILIIIPDQIKSNPLEPDCCCLGFFLLFIPKRLSSSANGSFSGIDLVMAKQIKNTCQIKWGLLRLILGLVVSHLLRLHLLLHVHLLLQLLLLLHLQLLLLLLHELLLHHLLHVHRVLGHRVAHHHWVHPHWRLTHLIKHCIFVHRRLLHHLTGNLCWLNIWQLLRRLLVRQRANHRLNRLLNYWVR